MMGAARVGLMDPQADLVAASLAVEAVACESAAAGMALALQITTLLARLRRGDGGDAFAPYEDAMARGEVVGALALSSEDVPAIENGRLHGRAAWVGPITQRGIAVVGARAGAQVTACAIALDGHGVAVTEVATSALRGSRLGVRDLCRNSVHRLDRDDEHHGAREDAHCVSGAGHRRPCAA
jgi:hypothetical protein